MVAVKASRYLTHIKRLKDPEEPVDRLMTHAAGLGDRLGPVLLQLPPTLQADAGLLDDCLGLLPGGHAGGGRAAPRLLVDARRSGRCWTARGAALCWADARSRPVTPLWRTTDWGYVRFHEGRARRGRTTAGRPWRRWVDRIATTWPDDADVYAYFNNDPAGRPSRTR